MSPMNRRTSTPPANPHSYVVRIYRRTPQGLVGQVQDVQTGSLRQFRTLAGLWSALGGRPSAGNRNTASKERTR
jgi:hypothetical protein